MKPYMVTRSKPLLDMFLEEKLGILILDLQNINTTHKK